MTGIAEMKSLNKFNIVDKPQEAALGRNAWSNDLMVALKNLSTEKSIFLSSKELKELGCTTNNLTSLRTSLATKAKKLGFKIGVISKDSGFYFFTR